MEMGIVEATVNESAEIGLLRHEKINLLEILQLPRPNRN